MSKKTFNLVTACTGAAATVASAVVTFLQPTYAVQTVAAIGILSTAVTEVCTLYVKD